MKISKLFHTLYAFLMFLPVMVLPLFAININQKEVEPLTAQIEETQVVNFNQLNNGSTFYDFHPVGPYGFITSKTINNSANHVIYIRASINAVIGTINNYVNVNWGSSSVGNYNGGTLSFRTDFYSGNIDFANYESNFFELYIGPYDENLKINFYDYLIVDLTKMFGIGNEPSAVQFDSLYPNDYYEYTTGRRELLYTGVYDTLDNTDIGSQFLYSLYNPLKDYFNLPNYMNLGGLYSWFLVNLFSGYNTPVYFVIFTLMIYWLALSLLWLIFDVLMYVPSMIHKMLDKARME